MTASRANRPLQPVPEPSPPAAAVAGKCMFKGAVTFGLVTVPIKLYAASGSPGTGLHQVHRADGARITMKRFCTDCGQEVPYADITKGIEMAGGTMAMLSDEEIKSIPKAGHEITVVQFCPAAQVDPLTLGKPYFLLPDAAGGRGYALLTAALARSRKIAIVRITLRSEESMAVLAVRDGTLVLQMLLWPDEVRSPAAVPAGEEVREAELRMAVRLITSMTADWDPAQHASESRAALEALITAKITGHMAGQPGIPAASGLIGSLRASVAAAGTRKGKAS